MLKSGIFVEKISEDGKTYQLQNILEYMIPHTKLKNTLGTREGGQTVPNFFAKSNVFKTKEEYIDMCYGERDWEKRKPETKPTWESVEKNPPRAWV